MNRLTESSVRSEAERSGSHRPRYIAPTLQIARASFWVEPAGAAGTRARDFQPRRSILSQRSRTSSGSKSLVTEAGCLDSDNGSLTAAPRRKEAYAMHVPLPAPHLGEHGQTQLLFRLPRFEEQAAAQVCQPRRKDREEQREDEACTEDHRRLRLARLLRHLGWPDDRVAVLERGARCVPLDLHLVDSLEHFLVLESRITEPLHLRVRRGREASV